MVKSEMNGCISTSTSMQGVRIPSYIAIDEESFNREYWPKLESAIKVILNKHPGQPFDLSFEDLYRIAYKCGSQNYLETMFHRLLEIVASHMSSVLSHIEELSPPKYLQAVDIFLAQFCQAVYGLTSIFSFMDRSYVVVRFGRNMVSVLNDQLTEMILANGKVFDTFQQISDGNLEMDPQIVMSVVKGLYAINHDFAKMNMTLFSRFVPNVSPTYLENLPSIPEEYCNFQKETSQNYDHERIINKRKVDEISEDLDECRKRIAKPV